MALRVANGSGNLSDSTKWDTVTNTPTIHASGTTTIGSVDRFTATFTAPNTTNACKGVLLAIVTKGTPNWTVTLQESSVDTAATVTVNNTDLSNYSYYVYFQFPTPYTFTTTSAGAYRFKVRGTGTTSTAGTVRQDSGASLIGFIAVDDRTGLGATDDLLVIGPNDGTTAAYTMTVRDGDSWGSNSNAVTLASPLSLTNALFIAGDSIVKWDTSTSTSATCNGPILVTNGGDLQMSDGADPYPDGQTATLIMAQGGTSAKAGIRQYNDGKLTLIGQPKSSTSLWKTTYVSGTGVPGDPLITADAVDWDVGDEIAIASTSDSLNSYQETVMRTILVKNSATSYEIGEADMMLNGAFETAGGGGADTFANWSETTAGGTIEQVSGAGETHSGTYALKATRTTSSTDVRQTFTVTPETKYQLRFWSRADSGGVAGRYSVQDVTGVATDITGIVSVVNGTTSTWVPSVVQVTTPAGCTSIRVILYSPATNGTAAYFDDVTLHKGGSVPTTRTTDAEIINLSRNVIIKGDTEVTTTGASYIYLGDATSGTYSANLQWARFENMGSSTANCEGIRVSVTNSKCAIDYCVNYRNMYRGFYFATTKHAETYTGLVAAGGVGSSLIGGIATGSNANKTFNDCRAIHNNRVGFEVTNSNSNTFNRCIAISNNRAGNAVGSLTGGWYVTGGASTFDSCESHANRVMGMTIAGPSGHQFIDYLSGTKGSNQIDIYALVDTLNTILFDNSLFGSATRIDNYTAMLPGSEVRFHKLNQTENNHTWYQPGGQLRSTGAGLNDTTIRTPGSLGLRMAPEDGEIGQTWTFLITSKANSITNFFGWFMLNSTFTGDASSSAKVELWLPGSSVPDATQTISKSTNDWQAVVLSASNTNDVDGLAQIKVNGITATPGAYLYADDFYNAGDGITNSDKVTGLDTWYQGKPIEIIAPSATSAADIWTFPIADLNTTGTTGNLMTKLLTVGKFLGLK